MVLDPQQDAAAARPRFTPHIHRVDDVSEVQEAGWRQIMLLDVKAAFDRLRLHAKPFEPEQAGRLLSWLTCSIAAARTDWSDELLAVTG